MRASVHDPLARDQSVRSSIDTHTLALARYNRRRRQTIVPVAIIVIRHRQVEFLRRLVTIDGLNRSLKNPNFLHLPIFNYHFCKGKDLSQPFISRNGRNSTPRSPSRTDA